VSIVTGADFLLPTGMLNPADFPGVDLATYADAWLSEAEDKTENAHAQAAWVYYRAYSMLADSFHAGVATAREGDVSGTKSGEQFAYWRERADQQLRAYRNLVGLEVVF
jgi:hypothetical protein